MLCYLSVGILVIVCITFDSYSKDIVSFSSWLSAGQNRMLDTLFPQSKKTQHLQTPVPSQHTNISSIYQLHNMYKINMYQNIQTAGIP